MSAGKCCQGAFDYFCQLLCVNEIMTLFSQWVPSETQALPPSFAGDDTGISLVPICVAPKPDGECTWLTCDPKILQGTERESTKVSTPNRQPQCSTPETCTPEASKTSTTVISGEASAPVIQRDGQYVSQGNTVDPCTPKRSQSGPVKAIKRLTAGKRNTYLPIAGKSRWRQVRQRVWRLLTATAAEPAGPQRSQQSPLGLAAQHDARREHDVVILRGFRDIMPLVRPSHSKEPEHLSTEDTIRRSVDGEMQTSWHSESSTASEECPPWLPESQLSVQSPHENFAAAASSDESGRSHGLESAPDEPTASKNSSENLQQDKSWRQAATHPINRQEDTGTSAGGCHLRPSATPEEDSLGSYAAGGAGWRVASQAVQLECGAVRFTRQPLSPPDQGASSGATGWSPSLDSAPAESPALDSPGVQA